MIFADLAINESFRRTWAGAKHIWVKVDDSTCILQGFSRPVPTHLPPYEEVISMETGLDPNNPTDGITYDPATRHSYITTLSNRNIGPPGVFTPDQVTMADIITPLALSVRYYGQIQKFYSVAEHSVLVSRMAELDGDEEAMLPGLLHDAHEAYTGDTASPQKDMIGPGMRKFEAEMQTIVRLGLGLPPEDDDVWKRVRVYDIQILHRELSSLKSTMPDWYDPKIEGLVHPDIQVRGFEWREARELFRDRLSDLGFIR